MGRVCKSVPKHGKGQVVVWLVCCLCFVWPPGPLAQAQGTPLPGRFVLGPERSLWLVTDTHRHPVWIRPIDFSTLARYFLAQTVDRPPAPAPAGKVTPALLALDGRIVGLESQVWLLLSGNRYRIAPGEIPDDAFEGLAPGATVTSLPEYAAALVGDAAGEVGRTAPPSGSGRSSALLANYDDPLDSLAAHPWRIASPTNGEPLDVDVLGGGWVVASVRGNVVSNSAFVVARVSNRGVQTADLGKGRVFLIDDRSRPYALAGDRLHETLREQVNAQGKFQLAPVLTPIAPAGSIVVGLVFDDVTRSAGAFELVSVFRP